MAAMTMTFILVHAIGELLVLLAALTLAVCKPRGTTRYGVWKQREQSNSEVASNLGSATKTPPWVKVFGVIVALLTLKLAVMLFGGGHGPGAHM